MRFLLCITIFVLSTLTSEAHARPASLSGSKLSQQRQNRVANTHRLSRICHLTELQKLISLGRLVHTHSTRAYILSPHLGMKDSEHVEWYRYTRPWTKRFLDTELREGHRLTGERFMITSLVRTKSYQRKLTSCTVNAISGRAWWKQSSHLTGATVDISYKAMSPRARRWLEKRLLQLERKGLIEATKEHRSLCFHIMVFPSY